MDDKKNIFNKINDFSMGRVLGTVMLFMGILLILLGYAMLIDAGIIFHISFAGPPFFLLGLALVIFPGSKDVKFDREMSEQMDFFKEASLFHKIIWGLFFLIGLAVTGYFIVYLFV